jgi:hypothetical protein
MRRSSKASRSQSTPQHGVPRGNQGLLPRVIALVVVGLMFGTLGLSAQKSRPREYEVKAAPFVCLARILSAQLSTPSLQVKP